MFDTYREHMEHVAGEASESQNAFAWSLMTRKPDDAARINDLVAAGRFVVVERGTDYCPSTDAIMGSRVYVAADFATRDEAEASLVGMYGEEGPDMDIDVYILPHKPEPEPIMPFAWMEDEIPF